MIKAERSLELSEKQIRKMTAQALDRIVTYFNSIEEIPMKDLSGVKDIQRMIREPIPTKGKPLGPLLEMIFEELLPKGLQIPSPGYLGYIPVGTVFPAVLAEFITYAINRWPGIYQYAPGFIEIENIVVRWLCEMMGLPKSAGGILTSGGSMANLSAIVAARHKILGEDFARGTLYFSEQAHHSIEKSARIVGISSRNLRPIRTDGGFRISLDALKSELRKDLQIGLKPFMLVGNAGTTGTGAVDDLPRLDKIARSHGMWFHVDAAWAGAIRLTRRGKALLRGTEKADSITVDPHKALYTPFGCGALLVRDPKALCDAHSFEAAYLPGEDIAESLMSPSKLSPELSRGLRGLQVWLPIKIFGINAFRKTVEEKLALAQWISSELRKIPGIQIIFEPQTAIVGFRYFEKGRSQAELNQMNAHLLSQINSDNRVFLSGIALDGDFTIRIIPFGQNTHFKQVKLTRDLIRKAVLAMNRS